MEVAHPSQHSQGDRDGDLGSSGKEGEGADNHLLERAEGWGQLVSFGKGQHHLGKSTVANESANQKPRGCEEKAKRVRCAQKKLSVW